MSGELATDLGVEALRESGRWALYWEVIHARGTSRAVVDAWATITDDERPAAQAGLDAARRARQDRLSDRARSRALDRADHPAEYVADARSAAVDIARESLDDRA